MHKAAATRDLPMGRGVAISNDGGETFLSDRVDASLPDPRCQGSILRYSWPDEGKSRIIFANAASESERKNLSVRVSFDEGQTWAATKAINNTWAAYSSLARLSDGRVGLLYETGDAKLYERIDFVRFPIAWLSDASAIRWQALPDLPDPLGEAGAYAGISGGAVLFAGGANFPKAPPWQGGEKVFSGSIHRLRKTPDGKLEWRANIGTLPRALAYGVSVSTDRGVILIGGCDASRCYAEVYRACVDSKGELQMDNLPPLPQPLAFATGALLGDAICIAGGQNTIDRAIAGDRAYRLDLAKEGSPDFHWEELPPLPKARVLAASAARADGFYVFSGRRIEPGKPTELLRDAYRFDPRTNAWETLPSTPHCMMAGSAIASSDGKIILLGGDTGEAFAQAEQIRRAIDRATDSSEQQALREKLIEASANHPGFAGSIVEFDPIARSYKTIGSLPAPAPVTAPALLWDNNVVLLSGEIRAAVRSPKVWLGKFDSAEVTEPRRRD